MRWRAGTTINNPGSLGLQKPVLYLQAYLWKGVECNNRFLDCCADVDASSISEEEQETFIKSIIDQAGHLVSAPDFRKDRQRALAKELLKPKYQVYGFKTGHLHKNLSGHFQNPAQTRHREPEPYFSFNKYVRVIHGRLCHGCSLRRGGRVRYEMNKLRARGILVKSNYKSFYTVTKKGFTWLWLQICSDNFFKNPMISRTMKNDVLKFAAQPSQMEEAYDLIHRGLSQLTQQLAINS